MEREEMYRTYKTVLDDAYAVVRNIHAQAATDKGLVFSLRRGRRAYNEGDDLLALLKEANAEVEREYVFGEDLERRERLVTVAAQSALDFREKYYWILLRAVREDKRAAHFFVPHDISRLEAFLSE